MKAIFRWTILGVPVAVVTGLLVALFLWLLDKVTALHWANPWLLYLLPVTGILVWFLYKKAGKNISAGNTLLLSEIRQPSTGVPARMAPMVLLGTLLTHLAGGSAGREGTAVQMGGSFAGWFGKRFKLNPADGKALLVCGIAAGFAAVFGTPFAATVFALEILPARPGRRTAIPGPALVSFPYLLPCVTSALLADFCCSFTGIHHTVYHVAVRETGTPSGFIHLDWLLLGKAAIMGIVSGLVALLFIRLGHVVKATSRFFKRIPWLFPFAGGCVIIILVFVIGRTDYLGLGVIHPDPDMVSVVSSFSPGGADTLSWFWKLLFTVVTIGTGFKGGEVTPLFFIGAALGNSMAGMTGAPVDLMAALGFIAVFAGATNTPFACIIMGIELFGGQEVLYYGLACLLAWYFSGSKGIYDPANGNRQLAGTLD
ncbi:MAG: voltage-gated chloride channel protein [Chitinophagaceae bacterium]|nr:MAG: voltage-gated chloride channel protein [Chitinophagaceae bacterium]